MRTSRAGVDPSRGGPCGGVPRGRRTPLPPVPLRAEPVESRMIHRECGVLKTTYEADMALYPLPIARWTVAALAVLFLLVLPFSVHEYYLSIVNLVAIAVVGALGLNILVGYTGQISIGHGAFMSVGAYTAANFAVRLGAPFWLALPLGGVMAAIIGAIVGIPSLRIKGLYLAIATDRKSTRLNSSHGYISYAVFCLKKKKDNKDTHNLEQIACYDE